MHYPSDIFDCDDKTAIEKAWTGYRDRFDMRYHKIIIVELLENI